MFKEFLFKIGAIKLVNRISKTNDSAWFRIHKDDTNLMQVIYQIISAYFQDDCGTLSIKSMVGKCRGPAVRDCGKCKKSAFADPAGPEIRTHPKTVKVQTPLQ